jgi:hypothetical protein
MGAQVNSWEGLENQAQPEVETPVVKEETKEDEK